AFTTPVSIRGLDSRVAWRRYERHPLAGNFVPPVQECVVHFFPQAAIACSIQNRSAVGTGGARYLTVTFRSCGSGVTTGVPAQAPVANGGQCCPTMIRGTECRGPARRMRALHVGDAL